jgi:DNA polymerase-3 subunit delta'
MTEAIPWPAALAGTPALSVIEQAISRQRLSHSLLLQGDDHDTLVVIAQAIADRLLHPAQGREPSHPATAHPAVRFTPDQHPDCFALRPAGRSRQISADATRELITRVQVSPAVAPRKVAILHEVDRMTTQAANIFLKTLEEPPANTTLLLLTTRPYALLPTIRSRVLHFRFPIAASAVATEGWPAWLDDYRAWLARLDGASNTDKQAVADHIFTVYGLVARFGAVLDFATSAAWNRQKESLPPDLEDDEQVAIEIGIANGFRSRLFTEIEQATRAFALPRLIAGDEDTRRALTAAVDQLEHDVRLLRLNLNESAALENFLLSSLRIWTRRL